VSTGKGNSHANNQAALVLVVLGISSGRLEDEDKRTEGEERGLFL
jgi:hypothetical protein